MTVSRAFRILILCVIMATPSWAMAQGDLLPQGIGLYQFGYRPYLDVTEKYNDQGRSESLAKPFNNNFNGPGLLKGVGGSQLQRLADHLHRFDGFSNSPNTLIQGIELGKLQGDVKAQIDARYFGVGYGWTSDITIFAGVPWVEATVDTNIFFSGLNNAALIKEKLGQAAFEELQSGLDEASMISTARIKQSFTDEGYAPIDHWQNQGIGDLQIGATTGRQYRSGRSMKSYQALTSTLSLPTGYQDDADILTDVGIGKGYVSFLNEASHSVSNRNGMSYGIQAGLGLNLPSTVERRVPESNESIVSKHRKALVDLTPGTDLTGKAKIGYTTGIFAFGFDLGFDVHTTDSYSGPIKGNYAKLGEFSDTYELYKTTSVRLSTTELYRKQKFPIPMIVHAKMHLPIMGKNKTKQAYFEFSVASFFKTQRADRPRAKLSKSKQASRSKSASRRNSYSLSRASRSSR